MVATDIVVVVEAVATAMGVETATAVATGAAEGVETLVDIAMAAATEAAVDWAATAVVAAADTDTAGTRNNLSKPKKLSLLNRLTDQTPSYHSGTRVLPVIFRNVKYL